MGLHDVALSWLAFCERYLGFQVEYSSRAINAYKECLTDEVFPCLIGCNVFVKLIQETFYLIRRKLLILPGLKKLPANFQIYIGTAIDVLVCYLALLRINLGYLSLAVFPLTAISFIGVLCMRHNNHLTGGNNNGKKQQREIRSDVDNDNGTRATVIPKKFNIVAILAPHFILCVFGMLGDPDHDGNNYDISNFCLFLICMLLHLTLMMLRLPAGVSRGIEPASELLYKASLVVLLLTAHVVAVDSFGKEVVLLLLPEVVPPLLWFSLHLDRRTSIVDVHKIKDSENFFLMPLLVAICGYLLVVAPEDEYYLFHRLYWLGKSSAASGAITCIVVLVLRLWPEKVGMATLPFQDAPKLLMFWGSVLLKTAVGLFALGGLVDVSCWSPAVVSE